MRTDWAQGDRVCTSCGVVDEERLLDDRPEWKDFAETEDLLKGSNNNRARCGLVHNNDSKFLGGLQPTGLSKRPFGSLGDASSSSSSAIRKTLASTNRKMDFIMAKQHKRALKRAKLSRMIQKKYNNANANVSTDGAPLQELQDEMADNDNVVAPEHDQLVLQDEQEAERMYKALQAEKWSLDRALFLHGDEQQHHQNEEERNELLSRLDAALKRASSDLYMAYSILQQAAQRLELPVVVTRHATNTLCHYATQKDGLTVKGVSSRLSSSSSTTNNKREAAALTQFNKQKQMAALAAALLFLEARKHGHARLLQQVCASFAYNNKDNNDSTTIPSISIKAKHCGKAMNELRVLFPDYMRSSTVMIPSDPNYFVEHATRKLKLPPVATACIQALVLLLQQEEQQQEEGVMNQYKLSTTCASVTLFITMVGTVMQKLAQQAAPYQSTLSPPPAAKRLKTGTTDNATTKAKSSSSSFDLFAHPALELQTYEMNQVWDAWSEQVSWNRSLADISQSHQVSQVALLDHYKTRLYPRRHDLLSHLMTIMKRNSSNNNKAPRAAVLLSQVVSCASPLLHPQGGSV